MSTSEGSSAPNVHDRAREAAQGQSGSKGKVGLVLVIAVLMALSAAGGWMIKSPCVKEKATEAEAAKPAHVELVEKAKKELPRIKELPALFEALIKDLEEGHAQLDRERAEHREKLEAYEKMSKILGCDKTK